MAGSVRFHNPKTVAPPPGYTTIVEVKGPARTIYVAGQLGIDLDNKFVEGFDAQCVQAHENMTAALKAVGASWRDVVKINNYIVDIETNMAAYRDIRDRYLHRKAPPASTTIGVPALARPGALFEVEAVAVLLKGKAKAAKAQGPKKASKKK